MLPSLGFAGGFELESMCGGVQYDTSEEARQFRTSAFVEGKSRDEARNF